MSTTHSSRRLPARLTVGTVAAFLGITLAGCSDSVDGNATAGGGGSSTSATTQTTQSSAAPTSPTETSTDGGGSDDGVLDCGGSEVLAPDGQPFCTDIPAGFTQTEVDTSNEAGAGAAYSTGLAISEQDVILFSVYALTANSDDLSDDELSTALAPVISQLATQGFTFDSQEPRIDEIDHTRAYAYTGNDGAGLTSDLYFIFRGSTELQVTCQWADQEDALLAGCDDVLASVQITG